MCVGPSACLVPCWGLMLLVILGSNLLVPVLSLHQTWTSNNILSSEEVHDKMQHFTGETDGQDFFKILLHEGDYILVGGRNKVYNISLLTLQQDVDRGLEWNPKRLNVKKCKNQLEHKLQRKCHNFIQVLGKLDGKYYVCGTNAYMPMCRFYEYKEPNYPVQVQGFEVIQEEAGNGKCPYDPEHNSTFIFTDDNLYSATVTDFMSRDPLIIDSNFKTRTEQYNSNMLNNPNFVSSFAIKENLFFLFREQAVENINCGKAVFSRIGRICKNDRGGRWENSWTSFSKARLNCSFPGDIPFSFDEIQATSEFGTGNYMSTNDPSNRTGLFYGVFNTPDNSIHGSAVCVFTYDDIIAAFHGRFKGQQSIIHNWLPIPVKDEPKPHPFETCMNDSKSIPEKTLEFMKEHPFMDSAVNTMGGAPILIDTSNNGRFTAIAIDWQVLANLVYYDIIFVGTSDGRVLKAINSGKNGEIKSTVIEDIQVLAKDEPISELKIYRKGETDKLIVVSRDNIVSIPLHRCEQHKFCGDCVAAQDPYCAWQNERCVSMTSRGIQNIQTGDASNCPDGGRHRATTAPPFVTTTTETKAVVEAKTECPACKCDCNQSHVYVELDTRTNNDSGQGDNIPEPLEPADDILEEPSEGKSCAPTYIPIRTDSQVYTASIIISCVVCILVAVFGFIIGYRVALCRANTRNTEQVINYEQHFGSLRKHSHRQSIETSHNVYTEPNSQKQFTNKINNVNNQNVLVTSTKNTQNGGIETKLVPVNQASKTYV